MPKVIDLTGRQYGRLTVLERAESRIMPSGQHMTRWKCLCSCGKTTVVDRSNLVTGHTKSCGCLNDEWKEAFGKNKKKQNEYEFRDEYVVGYTCNARPFYFDREDYEKIREYCWCDTTGDYVVARKPDGKMVKLHRLIMDAPNDRFVDHINHDVRDNRKCNLRIVNDSESGRNIGLSTRNKSGAKGVYRSGNRWEAWITIEGRVIYLGRYKQIEDAITARKAAEEKYFGEYSYDNSIAAVPRIAI